MWFSVGKDNGTVRIKRVKTEVTRVNILGVNYSK